MKIYKLLILLVCSTSVMAQSVFIGVVKPKHNVRLSLTTDGVVSKIFVKEGDLVKKGDTLIVLKNDLQSLEMQRRKLIWKDEARLNSSLAEKEILASLLESTKKLYQTAGGVSKSEFLSIKIKYLESLGEAKYLKENEKKELIEYKIAKKLLEQFTLRSPISGQVAKVNIDLGEYVKNTEPIISIVDSKICFVEMNIDKDAIFSIKNNQTITITSDIGSKKISKQAKIIFISPLADRSSGLFFVKAEFNNENLEILPGLTVSVTINSI